MTCSPEQTLILAKYNLEREENRHYVEIAEFLAEHDSRAPIYFHDPTQGLIWIEDLGADDLWSYRGESWLVRQALYDSALEEIVKLHCLPEAVGVPSEESSGGFRLGALPLGTELLFRELSGAIFPVKRRRTGTVLDSAGVTRNRGSLGNRPRVLIHRDFQSQNIMVRNAQAHLIDFQGMRFGLAEYDLASLLFDPYVSLSDSEREAMLESYGEKRTALNQSLPVDFRGTFRLCGIQRLMQALGAYGFLGLVKGNKAFLNHIPAAMKSLRALVDEIEGLNPLSVRLRTLDIGKVGRSA